MDSCCQVGLPVDDLLFRHRRLVKVTYFFHQQFVRRKLRIALGEAVGVEVFGHEFKHFPVEVFGDAEHVRAVVQQLEEDHLLGLVALHLFEDASHEVVVQMARDLAEVFERQIVGVVHRLIDAHRPADASGNLRADVLDHERNDDEVRNETHDRADGAVKLVKAVGFGVNHCFDIAGERLCLVIREVFQRIGKGSFGPGKLFFDSGHRVEHDCPEPERR